MTLCCALALALCDVVLALLPISDQLAVAHAASTNIAHLAVDPLFVLPASAFVDMGNGFLWVPLTLILIGGLERKFGAARALGLVFGTHVIATLLSEGVLLLQIASHLAPRSAINVLDVGPSYVILAALTGCLVIGGWRLRLAAVVSGMIVIPGLLVGLKGFDMSAVGHLTSIILGLVFAAGLSRAGRRASLTPPLVPSVRALAVRQPATV